MSAENKFGKFRNRYRKIYGFQRLPHDVRAYIDLTTGLTASVDVSRFIRDRDFFIIDGINPVLISDDDGGIIVYDFAEYEESLIYLNYESIKTVNFISPFTDTPIVTLDVWENGEDTDFIVPYVISVNASSMVIGVSAQTSGTLRYKAINLPTGVTYPAQVLRQPLFPTTTTLAAAGRQFFNNENVATLSFAEYATIATGSFPEFSVTTQDIGNSQADVHISKDSVGLSSSDIHLSADFSGSVNFIALKP